MHPSSLRRHCWQLVLVRTVVGVETSWAELRLGYTGGERPYDQKFSRLASSALDCAVAKRRSSVERRIAVASILLVVAR